MLRFSIAARPHISPSIAYRPRQAYFLDESISMRSALMRTPHSQAADNTPRCFQEEARRKDYFGLYFLMGITRPQGSMAARRPSRHRYFTLRSKLRRRAGPRVSPLSNARETSKRRREPPRLLVLEKMLAARHMARRRFTFSTDISRFFLVKVRARHRHIYTPSTLLNSADISVYRLTMIWRIISRSF